MSLIKDWIKTGLNEVADHAGPCEYFMREAYAELFSSFTSFRNEQQHILALSRLLKPDSCTIDVGAHAGTFLGRFLNCSPKGHHFAFEPLSDLHEALHHRFNCYSNVTLVNKAVSNKCGQSDFYRANGVLGTSSLRRWQHPQQGNNIEIINVEVVTLDREINRSQPISYIKIDVEGAELEVIEGALELIRRARPTMCIEHHKVASNSFGAQGSSNLFDALTDLDYRIFTIRDWLDLKDALDKDKFLEIVDESSESDYLVIPSK